MASSTLASLVLAEIDFALKVSKFQKQIFLFSLEPKNELNYFLISALASKNGMNQKHEGFIYLFFDLF